MRRENREDRGHRSTAKIRTQDVTLGYDEAVIIENLSTSVPSGEITSVVGPNGCGKSTLLRSLARLMNPRGGAVYLDGDAIAKLPTREIAKRLGILPQSPEALETTGVLEFADRPLDTLSGGQRQRAWISMALAQETETLLLDEPTTFLDMAHQLEVLQLLDRLNREEGRTILMVLHDLNNAARYSHHMIALARGKVYAAGSPEDVMTNELLREVFSVEAEIIPDPRTGTPLCIPYGLYHHTPA